MKRQVCVVLGGLLLALGLAGACTGTVVVSGTSTANGAGGGVRTCAPTGAPCSATTPCCFATCVGGACVVEGCGADGQACTDPGECCAGACTNGVCGVPTCQPDGASCTSDGQCCDGTCGAGVCGAPPPCQPDGASCTSDGQCCDGTCGAGVCGAPPPCQPDGTSCTSDGQCCAGACNAGVCGAPPSCQPDGTSCTSNGQCCGGTCSAGICGPNACLAKCVAGNMPAYVKFQGYELKECGCATSSPCGGPCVEACPPGNGTPSAPCYACLDQEAAKGASSACTVSAALMDCNQDPTCSPFVQCGLPCP